MKRRLICSLLLLTALIAFTPPAYGQGVGYANTAWKYTSGGAWPLSGATITVCPYTSTGIPCAPVSSVFLDKALTQPCTGVNIGCLTTDSRGNFSFFAAPGDYIYTITGTGITGYSASFSLPLSTTAANTFIPLQTFAGGLNTNSVNKTVYADQQAGATADVKIAACLALIPSGGICDATGFGATTQTLSASNTLSSLQFLKFSPATKFQAGSSSQNLFFLEPSSRIDGFQFDCGNQPSYSGILFQTDTANQYLDGNMTSIENVQVNSSCQSVTTGTVLQISSSSSGLGVAFTTHRHWRIFGLGNGVVLTATNGGFVNQNNFLDILCSRTVTACFNLNTPSTSGGSPSVSYNTFTESGYELTATGNPASIGVKAVATVGNIQQNAFFPTTWTDTTTPISFSGTGACNNIVIGRWDGTPIDGGSCNTLWESRLFLSNAPLTFNGLLTLNGGIITGLNGDPRYISNSDFERSTVIPPPTWALQGSPTITYETVAPAPNKKQSVKIASTAANTGLTSTQFYTARPSDTYTVRAQAKSDGTGIAFLALTWADKNGAVISTLNTTTTSAAWTQLSATGTAPATAVSFSIQLLNSNAAASSVWFDQISEADVSIVGAAISGSTLTSPVINGSPTGTGIATLTLKTGSGGGNYTGTNTTYPVAGAVLDSTNLCFVVTIPTGWKLSVSASGAMESVTAAVAVNVSLADLGTTCSTTGAAALTGSERSFTPPAAGTFDIGFHTQAIITGNGAAHAIALQALTSNAADAWGVQNTSASIAPSMTFTLIPSN